MRAYRYVHSDAFLMKNLGTFPVEGNYSGVNQQATEPDVQVCRIATHNMCLFCVRVDIVFIVYFCIIIFVGSLVLSIFGRMIRLSCPVVVQ